MEFGVSVSVLQPCHAGQTRKEMELLSSSIHLLLQHCKTQVSLLDLGKTYYLHVVYLAHFVAADLLHLFIQMKCVGRAVTPLFLH